LFHVLRYEVQQARSEISTQFARRFDRWFEQTSELDETLIVAHGFSKTVREICRTKLFVTDQVKAKGKVFVMESTDRDGIETRLMMIQLRHLQRELNLRLPIVTGDDNMIAHLASTRTRVLVLLGAECFDNTGRVSHRRGVAPRLRQIRDQMS